MMGRIAETLKIDLALILVGFIVWLIRYCDTLYQATPQAWGIRTQMAVGTQVLRLIQLHYDWIG